MEVPGEAYCFGRGSEAGGTMPIIRRHSGENITKIKGVFSGTLSYLFNNFSVEDRPFSQVLQEAIDKGFTEPIPREDLCGRCR